MFRKRLKRGQIQKYNPGESHIPALWSGTTKDENGSAGRRGFTLIELIVAFTILMPLTATAVPLARFKVRREREKELRWVSLNP